MKWNIVHLMAELVLLKLHSAERERSEPLLSSTNGYITGITRAQRLSFHSLYWVYTCVLLSLAAVRGRAGRDVLWVVAAFALWPVLILVLMVAVGGKATQNGGGGLLVPAATAGWNDGDSGLVSRKGLCVSAPTPLPETRGGAGWRIGPLLELPESLSHTDRQLWSESPHKDTADG